MRDAIVALITGYIGPELRFQTHCEPITVQAGGRTYRIPLKSRKRAGQQWTLVNTHYRKSLDDKKSKVRSLDYLYESKGFNSIKWPQDEL